MTNKGSLVLLNLKRIPSHSEPLVFPNQIKVLPPMVRLFWSVFLQVITLFILNSSSFHSNGTTHALGNETDHLALLRFKESISNDPFDILASWNSSTHFCQWPGITCSQRHPQRITSLILEGYLLHGSISPHVGNLSFLRILSLQNNSFYGIVPQELGRLFRLQELLLTNNTLVGDIPINLTSCNELTLLSLQRNNLIGKIPMEIGSLHKLQELYLSVNNLTGWFPASIWNISSLIILSAAYNNLEGNIPEEIGHLNLQKFTVPVNQLSGMLPSSLYNMSSLSVISIGSNKFSGSFPVTMFLNLPDIQKFLISVNQFSGLIPTSIINASKLQTIEMSNNRFVGQVPNLGMLPNLSWVNVGINNLGKNSSHDCDFLKSLMNCTKLTVLEIDDNNFGGSLPESMENFSNQLSQLYLAGNQISGNIPATLGNLVNLNLLTMEKNRFIGKIPGTLGMLQNMGRLTLWGNKLSGEIPVSIGNLSQLFLLDLSQNMLDGNIPPSIANCKNLQTLDLSKNNFRGAIPPQVISLSSLTIILNISKNSLSGSLPTEVGKLENIGTLDFSENHLSGDIPGTIGNCISLEYLDLKGNTFHGNIPSSLASLKGLQHLDLSRNNLSGSIPEALQYNSALEYLNVSFNMLDGDVPTQGVFRNATAIAVIGNSKLCGGILELHLPPCTIKARKRGSQHKLRLMVIIICVVVYLLLLSFVLATYRVRKRTMKRASSAPTVNHLPKVSYQNLYHASDGFSPNNLIGSGSFGSVYKGTLESEDRIVAIKVFKLQKKGAHKSFIAECNALRNIKHRNLVKILTCCSSTDYKGEEFKALVFEYLKNGSLEEWLNPCKESLDQWRTLDLNQRVNIIIDVATALHYLHHESEHLVIHCDLKPSNVLLDNDMVAHVSDFGIARLFSTTNGISEKQSSTIGINGTVGYAPPEYGMGSEVSTQGDIYSFGILVLEVLTGKRPTEDMFKDDHNLHNYVKNALSDSLSEIVDPVILSRELEQAAVEDIQENLAHLDPNVKQCLISLFEIGLACSLESPKERMNMVDVNRELNHIRNALLACGTKGGH